MSETTQPTVEALAAALFGISDESEHDDWENPDLLNRERYMIDAQALLDLGLFGRPASEVAHEALTDALHPEFGYEWAEPDGVIWKATQQARKDGVAAGMRYVTKAIRARLRDNWTGRLPVRSLAEHLTQIDKAAAEVTAMTITDWVSSARNKAKQ